MPTLSTESTSFILELTKHESFIATQFSYGKIKEKQKTGWNRERPIRAPTDGAARGAAPTRRIGPGGYSAWKIDADNDNLMKLMQGAQIH